METWKPVVGYEGFYEVSDLGRVRSVPRELAKRKPCWKTGYRKKGQLIKPQKRPNGYLFVNLHKDGIKRMANIHRLVAEAFIENPRKCAFVNHKDESRDNNAADNLEWCTHKENCNYGTAIKRRVEKQRNGKLSKPVDQLDLNGRYIKIFPSIKEADRQGFAMQNVSAAAHGRMKTAYGFKWRFATEHSGREVAIQNSQR